MKTPTACESLADVRAEIDRLDEQIIVLLRQRADYVHRAASFKAAASDIAAPERQASMLTARREWARREGLDPDVIEILYRRLIDYFIARETEAFHGTSR